MLPDVFRKKIPLILVGVGMVFVAALGGCSQQHLARADYVKGAIAESQGKMTQALKELNAAIKLNSGMVLAYEARGDIFRKKGDYHRAASNYKTATRLNPLSFHSWYWLGVSYQQLRRFALAIQSYQHALTIHPKSARASMNIAVSYAQNGNPFLGLIYAQRAMMNGADSFDALANLGVIYAQCAREDPKFRALAIKNFRSSLELQPRQPAIYLNLAQMYIAGNRYGEAARVLRTGQKICPTPLLSERLGYCYYRTRQYAKAIDSYKLALKQNPVYVPALNGLGAAYEASAIDGAAHGRTLRVKAIQQWHKSLSIDPNQPLIRGLVRRFAVPVPAASN
jgi:tetratricopeptide (TPR) repeat protein